MTNSTQRHRRQTKRKKNIASTTFAGSFVNATLGEVATKVKRCVFPSHLTVSKIFENQLTSMATTDAHAHAALLTEPLHGDEDATNARDARDGDVRQVPGGRLGPDGPPPPKRRRPGLHRSQS